MPDINVYESFKELIQRLLSGDEEVAELAATDPEGLLAAFGLTEADLDGLNFREAVAECYPDHDLPASTKQTLDNYVGGGAAPEASPVKEPPPHGGHQSVEQAVQHLQYVTYARYENNETITREIVNNQFSIDQSDNRDFSVDNSTTLDGIFRGDVSVENTTAQGDGAIVGDENIVSDGDGDILNATRGGEINSASGDGSVAGGGDVAAATAAGAQAIGGDNDGLANTGDEAVQGEEIGAANTGRFDGVQAGDEVRGAVNTGENTGVLAEGRVENTVVGDDNQTANLDIRASGATGGSGNTSGDGGSGTGRIEDSNLDIFRDDARDTSIDASGTGGAGGDLDASGGSGGDVGPINLNFGSGDQTNAGDVANSAVASGGDATNQVENQEDDIPGKLDDPSTRERLERLSQQEEAEASEQPPIFEEGDGETVLLPVEPEEEFSGALEQGLSQEASFDDAGDEATEEPVSA